MMKKLLSLLLALLAVLPAAGQAQITTKKVRIADFTEKTLKVVLTGNELLDSPLMEEVSAYWRMSPYEFCSGSDFERLKTSADYYFLLVVQGRFRKESAPGVNLLTLVKGGPEAAQGLDRMLDVVSVPWASIEEPEGREFTFLGALLDIIQDFTARSMKADTKGYGGLTIYNSHLGECKGKQVFFDPSDISQDVNSRMRNQTLKEGMAVSEDADRMMAERRPGAVVSYTVAPSDGRNGSYCYKMLIDCETHALYCYRKHRLSAGKRKGFQLGDLQAVAKVLTL